MRYFVTGASGFIGKRLVKKLLARRGAVVHILLRPDSRHKLDVLRAYWGASSRRVVAVAGDLCEPGLGVTPRARAALTGRVDHFFHLGALYHLEADEASQERVNVEGTRRAVSFAQAIRARHFHHVSSIAAAGLYEGVFREDMFEEATGLWHPYFRTKHEAERIVRERCRLPWTLYRPAMVVGDSHTGEMDKVDGPCYLFKPIQRLRQWWPAWLPAPGLEGGCLNIVPVDFVVAALDHISHQRSGSGGCYHLVDPKGYEFAEVLSIFAQAAGAPKPMVSLPARLPELLPPALLDSLLALEPVRRARAALMKDLGLPEGVFAFLQYPTRFDRRCTDAALAGTGIECPDLHDYAPRLWDYWAHHLDPELVRDRSLQAAVGGRVVLVTGGSSGIGLAAAKRFAQAGAVTVICARDAQRLAQAEQAIRAVAPGTAQVHAYPVDLTDAQACDAFVRRLQTLHGGVDVLVNNAGRSIRRSIEASYERLHDFERSMQLNYFGALRLLLGLLPGMVARGRGHVVNISSIGVLTSAPRFAAYVASKAALDAWTRCAASEFADRGVSFTTIHMPLVRTPMIAPTRLYDHAPALSPEEAADLVVQACVERPARIATPLGWLGEAAHALAPALAHLVMNTLFRLLPDSAAACGEAREVLSYNATSPTPARRPKPR